MKSGSGLRVIRIQKHGPEMFLIEERFSGDKFWTYMGDAATYRAALRRAVASLEAGGL